MWMYWEKPESPHWPKNGRTGCLNGLLWWHTELCKNYIFLIEGLSANLIWVIVKVKRFITSSPAAAQCVVWLVWVTAGKIAYPWARQEGTEVGWCGIRGRQYPSIRKPARTSLIFFFLLCRNMNWLPNFVLLVLCHMPALPLIPYQKL